MPTEKFLCAFVFHKAVLQSVCFKPAWRFNCSCMAISRKLKDTVMKNIFLIIGFVSFFQIAMGQIPESIFQYRCFTDIQDSSQIAKLDNSLALYKACIPYECDVVKTIPINWIFLQKDNGEGGFQEDNQDHQRYWDEIERRIEYRFANLKETSDAACFAWKDPFLSDTKIRFSFNRIYIRDSYAWDRNNYTGRPTSLGYMTYLIEEIENDPAIPRGINVFFTADGYWYDFYADAVEEGRIVSFDSTGNFGVSFEKSIHMADVYTKYLWMRYMLSTVYNESWEETIVNWWTGSLAILISHELAHALGLFHECAHYDEGECEASLMNPVGDGGHDYLPPSEVGKMHYRTMSSKFLTSIIPQNTGKFPTLILDEEYHEIGRRIYSDVVVASGGRVMLLGEEITVAPNTSITVEGFLHLGMSTLRTPGRSAAWKGIRVKAGGVIALDRMDSIDFDIILEPGSYLLLQGKISFLDGHKMIVENNVQVCTHKNLDIQGRPICRMGDVSFGMPADFEPYQYISCTESTQSVFYSASSLIPDVLYVQNQQIGTNQTLVAEKIIVGSNVTSSKPSGQVTIEGGAHVNFISLDGTRFEKGFRCENGSTFTVTEMEE